MKPTIASGAVLMGVLGLCLAAGSHREAPLVGHQKLDPDIRSLEDLVAAHPESEEHLVALAGHYVERGAPGLALAVLRRAPPQVRGAPRVAHLSAIAWMHEGRASDALDNERAAIAACNDHGCSPWVLASAMRHEQFLLELVRSGVEDFRKDPDATLAAYGRLSRALVAVLELPAPH